MGNSHSPHDFGRRRSLVREEFLFPETDLEDDQEWEFFHVHIELKPLSEHARDSIHICVDDYTQEILSWEEDCVCACASTGERETWGSNSHTKDSVCECLERKNDRDFCFQWDVYTDDSLDSGQTETDYSGIAKGHKDGAKENVTSLVVNPCGEACIQDCRSLENPCGEDVSEASTSHDDRMENPVSQSHQIQKEPTKPIDIPEARQRKDFSSNIEMNLSQNREPRCGTDCGAMASRIWTGRRASTTDFRTRAKTMASQTSADQDQPLKSNTGTHPRRQSCSIPILRDKTRAMQFQSTPNSKKRKFSLKEEPGWIPNPLDSDSDSSDFEDSGVFSDYTGSPSMSSSPACYVPATSRATAKIQALSRERRRYNSEPIQRTSTLSTDAEPSLPVGGSPSSSGTKTRRGSRWRLLGLSRKFKPPQKTEDPKTDDTVPAEDSTTQDEDDLTEQLRWLTMCDSQISQDTESSSPEQSEEDLNLPETSPNPDTTSREPEDTRAPPPESSGEEVVSRRRSGFDGELELDWLCEPEWNNLELELFWSVLRPHLEQLLQPEDSELLPEACRAVGCMDAADPKMLDRCLLHVQWHIWKGSYCQAVADFRAIRRHFLCCAQSQLIESGTRNDVENLRLIFQRKRPSRFRLWI